MHGLNMFKTQHPGQTPAVRTVGQQLDLAGRWIARIFVATAVLGLAATVVGGLVRVPLPAPAQVTDWPGTMLPAWASILSGVGGLSIPFLLWGLAAGWVGRTIDDHGPGGHLSPRAAQWIAGLGASTLLAALAQLLVGLGILSLSSLPAWGWDLPLVGSQVLWGIYAVPVGGVALLVTMTGGIWWAMALPARPASPRAHPPLF